MLSLHWPNRQLSYSRETQPPSGRQGWGDAFLNYVQKPAIGTNFGRGGRTTVSFRTDGTLAKVIEAVKRDSAQYAIYVTIQVLPLVHYIQLLQLTIVVWPQ
jgi:hypothetical protein